MKRDVGYAVVAALTLTILAALWTLVKAPDLANPDQAQQTRGLSGSVPVRPPPPDNSAAIEQAVGVLDARDLFEAAAPADVATLNRLSTARIAPPVELVPVEPRADTSRYAATPRPVAPQPRPPRQQQVQPFQPPQSQPAAPPPRPVAPAPSSQQVRTVRDPRFPLTLRGVFPDARTGGRALVALPNGQVVPTGPGGVILGFQVMQINVASIIVQQRGGPLYRVEMPGY